MLLVTVIFISSCAPKPAGEIPAAEKEQVKERDDFGCWSPSCSFISDPQGKQLCEDWKAGKEVQWFDCSAMAAFPKCVKLCEFEKENGGNVQQDFPRDVNDLNYSQYSNYPADEHKDTGIPREDPGAENFYIYFTDFRHGRLIRIDDMTGKGWIEFGKIGSGVNQFNEINQVVTDKQGRIYITDQANNRMVRIDDMLGKGWVEYKVTGPYGMDLDSQERIYLVEQGLNHLVRINNVEGGGKIIFGGMGSGVNEFNGIKYLEVDSQDRIYVGDKCNYRIIRFDDMTGGNWIAFQSNGKVKEQDAHCGGTDLSLSGSGAGQFRHEVGGITLDSQGRIYVADEHNDRVIRMDDMAGKGWAEFKGVGDDKLHLPHDIAISKSGKIYIADTGNNRIVRIDDFTGKGWIAFAPYAKDWGRGTHEWQLEAPKGIFVLERK